MIVQSTGDTYQEKMISLNNVRGYDPALDAWIDQTFSTLGLKSFLEIFCDMDEATSFSEWSRLYDYPIQYMCSNPGYPVSIDEIKDIYYEDREDEEVEEPSGSYGLQIVCPICSADGNILESFENRIEKPDGFECLICETDWETSSIGGEQIIFERD